MAIYESFSKRMKRLSQQGQSDVYQYTELPKAFRVQVVHIWRDVIPPEEYWVRDANIWPVIHNALARELGLFELSRAQDNYSRCEGFLLSAATENALDLIELSFKVIDHGTRDHYNYKPVEYPQCSIDELNYRFREHSIGFQFENGELIRVDSQFVHAEVVKPALSLLHDAGFKGAEQEFLKAHEHYRHGRIHEAMVDGLKAFESTMKGICDARNWTYPPTAPAKPLLDVLFEKELIPPAMQSHFSGLRTTLEAGLPTVRNRNAGHGQGATPVDVPDYLAAYALHLAATNIVMIIQAHKAKP